jgi:hypothetical protein
LDKYKVYSSNGNMGDDMDNSMDGSMNNSTVHSDGNNVDSNDHGIVYTLMLFLIFSDFLRYSLEYQMVYLVYKPDKD